MALLAACADAPADDEADLGEDSPAADEIGLAKDALNDSTGFAGQEIWSNYPYYGDRPTYATDLTSATQFADINNDGRADAIAINGTYTAVRLALTNGTAFDPTHQVWSSYRYYGTRGTYFADVTGDGLADGIVVNDNTVTVRRTIKTCAGGVCKYSGSTEHVDATDGPYYGGVQNFFADVNGDRRADAVVINSYGAAVRLARTDGSGKFEAVTAWWTGTARGFYRLDDVTGDGRADLLEFDSLAGTVFVRVSTGSSFTSGSYWLTNGRFSHTNVIGVGRVYRGGVLTPTLFRSDVWGGEGVRARYAQASPSRAYDRFSSAEDVWSSYPYFGTRGTAFVDVTGDGQADAVVVNNPGIVVRRASAPK